MCIFPYIQGYLVVWCYSLVNLNMHKFWHGVTTWGDNFFSSSFFDKLNEGGVTRFSRAYA